MQEKEENNYSVLVEAPLVVLLFSSVIALSTVLFLKDLVIFSLQSPLSQGILRRFKTSSKN